MHPVPIHFGVHLVVAMGGLYKISRSTEYKPPTSSDPEIIIRMQTTSMWDSERKDWIWLGRTRDVEIGGRRV